jgi:hypothetical protein
MYADYIRFSSEEGSNRKVQNRKDRGTSKDKLHVWYHHHNRTTGHTLVNTDSFQWSVDIEENEPDNIKTLYPLFSNNDTFYRPLFFCPFQSCWFLLLSQLCQATWLTTWNHA